uniref:Uncharacterized protein n=1 Tax=Ascaris lumbricoides TaxID=6252 RepID=A0A0M3HQZ2_ASCLU
MKRQSLASKSSKFRDSSSSFSFLLSPSMRCFNPFVPFPFFAKRCEIVAWPRATSFN